MRENVKFISSNQVWDNIDNFADLMAGDYDDFNAHLKMGLKYILEKLRLQDGVILLERGIFKDGLLWQAELNSEEWQQSVEKLKVYFRRANKRLIPADKTRVREAPSLGHIAIAPSIVEVCNLVFLQFMDHYQVCWNGNTWEGQLRYWVG